MSVKLKAATGKSCCEVKDLIVIYGVRVFQKCV